MKKFNLELTPLKKEDLETVRMWRNDADIAQFMEYQENITPEQQIEWFNSLDEKTTYFIIQSNTKKIGLINLKNIDLVQQTAESGLFIGNKSFMGTGITLGASIILLDYAFEKLNLNTVTAKVNKKNSDAKMYNELIGFTCQSSLNDQFCHWTLDKEVYMTNRPKLVQMIS